MTLSLVQRGHLSKVTPPRKCEGLSAEECCLSVLSFRASDASPPDPPSVIPSVHVYRRRAAMGNNALAVQDLALCTKLRDLGRSKVPFLNTS